MTLNQVINLQATLSLIVEPAIWADLELKSTCQQGNYTLYVYNEPNRQVWSSYKLSHILQALQLFHCYCVIESIEDDGIFAVRIRIQTTRL